MNIFSMKSNGYNDLYNIIVFRYWYTIVDGQVTRLVVTGSKSQYIPASGGVQPFRKTGLR